MLLHNMYVCGVHVVNDPCLANKFVLVTYTGIKLQIPRHVFVALNASKAGMMHSVKQTSVLCSPISTLYCNCSVLHAIDIRQLVMPWRFIRVTSLGLLHKCTACQTFMIYVITYNETRASTM